MRLTHIFIQPVLASYPGHVGGEKRGLGTRLPVCDILASSNALQSE